jgi:hypothetical protein
MVGRLKKHGLSIDQMLKIGYIWSDAENFKMTDEILEAVTTKGWPSLK